MEIPSQPTPPAVRVAAYVDATEEHFEPHAVSRVDAFEKAVSAAPNLDIQAHVVRNGTSASRKLARGLGLLALHVLPPVIGQATFGLPGLALGSAITGWLVYKGYTMEAGRELGGAAHQPFTAPGPRWTGTRTYQIGPDQTDGIDSEVLSSHERIHATASEVGDFMSGHFQEGATNIAYVTGHGWGPWKVASLFTKDLAGEVGKQGVQPDVVVFESCLMGNLEALTMLKGRARVAVVSEELLVAGGMGAGHMPIRAMLADAARQGGTPQEIGARMVSIAHRAGVPTLAAIDLDQLDPLLSELGTLSDRLLAQPDKAELRAAFHESLSVPILDHQLGGKADFIDLGDFLKRIGATEAREALDKAILARTAGPDHADTTGLSICTRIPKGGEPIYAGLPLPDSFRQLMKELTA